MTRKFYILLLVLLPLMAASASQATPDSLLLQMAVKIDTSQVAPVVFEHDTLFQIHAGMKGLSAIQRAEVIQRRIIEALAETDIPLDSLVVEDTGFRPTSWRRIASSLQCMTLTPLLRGAPVRLWRSKWLRHSKGLSGTTGRNGASRRCSRASFFLWLRRSCWWLSCASCR